MSYIQGYANVLIVYQNNIAGTKQKNNSFFFFDNNIKILLEKLET
jgi:hypothetical protein